MTSLSTQIEIDDGVMEYEPKPRPMFLRDGCGTGAAIKKPAFQVIHDMSRPRSQSLCLVKSLPPAIAQPVEPMLESPMIESQWRVCQYPGHVGHDGNTSIEKHKSFWDKYMNIKICSFRWISCKVYVSHAT